MIAAAPRAEAGLPRVLAASAWADRVRPEWFDLRPYGANALPISTGGRGAAWYLEGPFGSAVLRLYRRGGLAARLSAEHYLWFGESRGRCVRELRLLEALHAAGLAVPEPIAAAWWREGLFYRAALLMVRVPVRADFLSLLHDDAARAPWAAVGQAFAAFERAGARHPDLNARNVLLRRDGMVVLIDWDRGHLGAAPGRWAAGEIARFERSLRKYRRHVAPAAIDAGMAVLRAAHAAAASSAA